MEQNDKLKSGFKIINMLLLESSLFRTNNVSFDKDITNNIGVEVDVNVSEQTITVIEEVVVSQKNKEIEQVKIKVKMVGVFEVIGNPSIQNFDNFGKVNGAAIIFPYIREHITNLSVKAGLGAIILPPVNFTNNGKE